MGLNSQQSVYAALTIAYRLQDAAISFKSPLKIGALETSPKASNSLCLWGVFVVLVLSGCLSRLYFGVLVRDQAELAALSQHVMPVYDEQIPVLTWGMTGLFRATNYFILWPDIYKFACLGLCLFSVFRLTAHITKNTSLALMAALSLFFLPTFHEDMLGEVTHTAALLAATALSTEWMVRRGPSDLMKNKALVVLVGFWLFGFFAKHTMGLVILAQVLAYCLAFKLPKQAKVKLVLSAGLTFAFILPIYALIASQLDTLGAGMAEFQRDEGFSRGLVDLLSSILAEAAIFILLGLVAFLVFRLRKTFVLPPFQTKESRFLVLTLLIMIALFIPFIIAADIAVFRDRWLAPAFILLGPLFALLLSNAAPKQIRRLGLLMACLACLLGLFRAAEPYLDKLSGEMNIDNAPLAAMSENLRKAHPEIGTYIAPNYNLIATLKLQDPRLRIYTQKTLRSLSPEAKTARSFILLSLERDPPLHAPDLRYDCGPKRQETLSDWSYAYQICTLAE